MKQKLKNIIPIVIFPFIQFGLLGPMEIYSANYLEFVAISKWTVFFEVLIASLLGILIVSTILMILKTKILDFFLKIIFSVTLVSYLQYLFLNSHITDLTGNGISWDSEFYKKLIIENLVVWIIAISLVFTTLLVLKQKGKSVAVVLSSILSIMQIVAVVSILITAPAGSNDSYRVSSEGTFDIASDGNILVLVIDSYGNEMFDSYVEKNPEELDQLKDFTYFNNCDCHYHRTLPSMAHMITGYNVENYKGDDYRKDAWHSESTDRFFSQMHDAGWKMKIFCDNDGNYYGKSADMEGYVENIEFLKGNVRWKRLLVRFIDESIFVFSPYIIKPYFEQLTTYFRDINSFPQSFDDTTRIYCTELEEHGLEIDTNINKQITITHLFGAHDVEELEDLDVIHETINAYLAKLKAIDKYDSSTIIIMGDHAQFARWNDIYDTQPIMLIKLPNEQHEVINKNAAPISLDDIRATWIKIMGIPSEEYGKSVYEYSEDENRERTFFYKDNNGKYLGYSYVGNRKNISDAISEGVPTIAMDMPQL